MAQSLIGRDKMGQSLGIFAKSKGILVRDTPIMAEEESYYSLANIFMDSENYLRNVLITSK